MSDPADAPRDEKAPPDVDTLTCPECGADKDPATGKPFTPLSRGRHRKQKHGVASSNPKGAGGRRKRRADRAPRDPAAARPTAQASLKKDLERVFDIVGTSVAAFGDTYCGDVLAKHSSDLCAALARLADEDPRIAKWLRGLGKAGPYGALLVAAGELAVPILAHHGKIPVEAVLFIDGVDVPDEIHAPRRGRRAAPAPTLEPDAAEESPAGDRPEPEAAPAVGLLEGAPAGVGA